MLDATNRPEAVFNMLIFRPFIHSVGLTFGARPGRALSPSRWDRFCASAGHSESNYGVFDIRLRPTLQGSLRRQLNGAFDLSLPKLEDAR